MGMNGAASGPSRPRHQGDARLPYEQRDHSGSRRDSAKEHRDEEDRSGVGSAAGPRGSGCRGVAVVPRHGSRRAHPRSDGRAQRRQLSVRGEAGAVRARLAAIHRVASSQPQGRPRGLLRHPPRHRSAARSARAGADAVHAALAAAGAGGGRLLLRQAAGGDRRYGGGPRAQRGRSHLLAGLQPSAADAVRRQAQLGRCPRYAAVYRQLEDEARREHAPACFRGRRRGGRSDARQPAGRVDHGGQPARLARSRLASPSPR